MSAIRVAYFRLADCRSAPDQGITSINAKHLVDQLLMAFLGIADRASKHAHPRPEYSNHS